MPAACVGLDPRLHDVFVGLGVLVGMAVFAYEMRRRHNTDARMLVVATTTLLGGALMARLGTWFQHVDLSRNHDLLTQFVYGNRSILGGIAGAWAGAHVGKRLVGMRERTGAYFAPACAAAMAVGRIECALTELPGTPTALPWGVRLDAQTAHRLGALPGVPLHPSLHYEIVFHAAAFVALVWARDRLPEPGDLFVLYAAAYAVFRLLVEFVRGNEVVWAHLSRPQLFLLITLPVLVWRTVRIVRAAHRERWRVVAPRQPVPQETW